MSDERADYEPIVYATAVNVSPEHLEALNQAQLPKDPWGIGTMLEEPIGVDIPGRGYLIRIAVHFHDGVYIDPGTGEVLWMRDLDWPVLTTHPRLLLVNSSLQQYTRTQQAIMDAVPFTDGLAARLNEREVDNEELDAAWDRDIAQRTATALKLRERFQLIDSVAMTPPSYWEGFTMDVEIGDFSTDDLGNA